MSTFAAAIKQEIVRLARKELKKVLLPLRSLATRQRDAIVALKGQIRSMASSMATAKPISQPTTVSDDDVKKARFSPILLAKLRKNKKLSRAKLARLIGASAMTVKLWESGKFRPSAKYRKALVWARSLSKTQIKKLLATNKAQ